MVGCWLIDLVVQPCLSGWLGRWLIGVGFVGVVDWLLLVWLVVWVAGFGKLAFWLDVWLAGCGGLACWRN